MNKPPAMRTIHKHPDDIAAGIAAPPIILPIPLPIPSAAVPTPLPTPSAASPTAPPIPWLSDSSAVSSLLANFNADVSLFIISTTLLESCSATYLICIS